MNTDKRDFYDRSGAPWDDKEDGELKREYIEEEQDIMQIGISHHRTPGGIGYRLKNLGSIASQKEARGYFEYVKSPLYRDIVSKSAENKKERTEKSGEKQKKNRIQAPSLDVMDIYSELTDIKRDIRLLYDSISELKQIILCIPNLKIIKPLPLHKQLINYIE